MASDQLRKKWGTIFMGEREATPQQLDAMQEPLLRERAQHQQQEDYLARVRARAEERAREILGAAYAERQKVLEEAEAEAQTRVEQLTREARAVKAQAQAQLAEAEAEHGKARDLREEAEHIRSNAHNEGFQAGMEQAGAELKEFRADVGQMLGNMLRALEAQRHSLGEAWREELAELARVAVEAGTGWILQAEHQRILQNLVFASLQLLEDRATVTIRVHPEDEDAVSDLFRAARERVPELSQWIVNGDPSVEAGGLVAESVSGSVENLREHYHSMVNGILEHLTLPKRPEEESASAAVSAAASEASARLEQVAPEAALAAESFAESLPGESAELAAAEQAAFAGQDGAGGMPDGGAAMPDMHAQADAAAAASAPHYASLQPADGSAPDVAGGQPEAPIPFADAAGAAAPVSASEGMQDSLPESTEHAAGEDFSEASLPPAQPDDGITAQSGHGVEAQPGLERETQPEQGHAAPPANAYGESQGEGHADAPAADMGAGRNVNPSLAELEDELFPLPEEEQERSPESSSSVFVSGGFLPGSGNGQPG